MSIDWLTLKKYFISFVITMKTIMFCLLAFLFCIILDVYDQYRNWSKVCRLSIFILTEVEWKYSLMRYWLVPFVLPFVIPNVLSTVFFLWSGLHWWVFCSRSARLDAYSYFNHSIYGKFCYWTNGYYRQIG